MDWQVWFYLALTAFWLAMVFFHRHRRKPHMLQFCGFMLLSSLCMSLIFWFRPWELWFAATSVLMTMVGAICYFTKFLIFGRRRSLT